MVGCFSCMKRSPSPPKKTKSPTRSPNYGYNLQRLFGGNRSPSPLKKIKSPTRGSPNYGYNLQRLFGGNPRNTKSTNLPPQVMSIIANSLKRGRNVRKLARQLPESYARYITLRKPQTSSSGIASHRAYLKTARTLRGIRHPFNKKHLLNVLLPIAYKNTGWTHYSMNGGRLQFYNANGRSFTISNKGRRRINPMPLMMNVTRIPRRNGNNWQSYLKRIQKYARYVKGEHTRKNILDEIERTIHLGTVNNYTFYVVPNKWIKTGLVEKGPGNRYRWSNRALKFYLAKRHSHDYKKIPGYGITRRNGPIKMTRKNIIENLNMMYQ